MSVQVEQIVCQGTSPLGITPVVYLCTGFAAVVNMRPNGNDSVSAGTSAVAPQWAALTAVVSQASRKRLAHSSTPIQKPRPMTSLSAITRCLEWPDFPQSRDGTRAPALVRPMERSCWRFCPVRECRRNPTKCYCNTARRRSGH